MNKVKYPKSSNLEYLKNRGRQKNATLQLQGILFMGPKFHITDGERKEIVMDVVSFEKNKLVLRSKAGDIKTLIKQVKLARDKFADLS